MIRKLTVSNYRSLDQGVTVNLGSFTAFVGSNGSGKSNVVDVLHFVRDAMHIGLNGAITNRNGVAAVRRWSSGRPFNVTVAIELGLATGHGTYAFELAGDKQAEFRVNYEEAAVFRAGVVDRFRIENGHWEGPAGLLPLVDEASLALPTVGGDERFQPLFDALKNTAVYAIFPDTLRQPQKYNPEKPMLRHGENWVSILQDQEEESWKPELVAALCKLAGDIEDVRTRSRGDPGRDARAGAARGRARDRYNRPPMVTNGPNKEEKA